jgi:2-polyprenyl-3-methyl-5-hydroxy-6-metoxy-1,4-benzoquinol methylase
VFVPEQYFLSANDEKAFYDTHENNPDDPGYRRFLERLVSPLKRKLHPGSRGLDFGSGPGPTLSVMLEELGFPVNNYDIYYANDPAVLQEHYDFIVSTETIEHLHHPGSELQRLWSLLKPGGHFAVMTQFVQDKNHFANWRYKRDPTHVSFFSKQAFQWLAQHWQAPIEFAGNGVVLMTKP